MNLDKEPDDAGYVSYSVAAKALGVHRSTVYKMVSRQELTAVVHDGKKCLNISEVRQVRDKLQSEHCSLTTKEEENAVVTVPRAHYDGLLVKLGQYQARETLLLSHQEEVERKEEELQQAREKISQLESELKKAKQAWWTQQAQPRPSFWKRLFGRST